MMKAKPQYMIQDASRSEFEAGIPTNGTASQHNQAIAATRERIGRVASAALRQWSAKR